jgi:L-iditol 2-dehydrogenase
MMSPHSNNTMVIEISMPTFLQNQSASYAQREKMLAAVYRGPNNIRVEEVLFPNGSVSCQNEEVKVMINACAICGYDARVFRTGHQKVTPPIILGHEVCGQTLEAVAIDADQTIEEGSRVVISPLIPCLKCWYCNNEQYNLCMNLKEIGSTVDGGFAEYLSVPKQTIKIKGLVQVPDSLSNEEASLLEPLACCLNGFSQIRIGERIARNSTIVILGDGPIGLLHLQLSKVLYEDIDVRVAVIGRVESRLQKAKVMGADAVFTYDHADDNNKTLDDILTFTNGMGANTTIVATSNPEALDFSTKIASKGSNINIFAGMPKQMIFSLDPNWIHYNQVTITGSFSSTPQMLQKAAKLAGDKKIDLSKIITHTYSLKDIEEAIWATEQYRGLRVVINKF